MKSRSARSTVRGNQAGRRRTPWTPIFDNPVETGTVSVGNTPAGSSSSVSNAVGITDEVVAIKV